MKVVLRGGAGAQALPGGGEVGEGVLGAELGRREAGFVVGAEAAGEGLVAGVPNRIEVHMGNGSHDIAETGGGVVLTGVGGVADEDADVLGEGGCGRGKEDRNGKEEARHFFKRKR